MNRYLIVHRLRWPALLLLTGVLALLDQADIVHWGRSWPLYLVLLGVLALAERAVMVNAPPPVDPYAGPYAGYPQSGYGNPVYGAAAYPASGVASQPVPSAQSATSPAVFSTGIVPASGDVSLRRSTAFEDSVEEEGR